jgi:glycosyltransferase involved in cell wall biosynthesis
MSPLRCVSIGIPFRGGIGRLQATLASLRANTCPLAEKDAELGGLLEELQSIEVFLLVEAGGSKEAEALKAACAIPQLPVTGPGGGAACFNRLSEGTFADVLILLENGAQVGPGWLGCLLSAIGMEGRVGVAGPSTNLSRTSQCQPARGGGGPLTIDTLTAAAREMKRLFGTESLPCETVEEFCLAVRRDVVAAVGAANESPQRHSARRWDDDYCARAKRAGFQSVWVCASYVHRAPHITLRVREPIGRRANEPSPLSKPDLAREQRPTVRTREAIHRPRHVPPMENRTVEPEPPLISCIMPTRDRHHFVRQAIAYFLRQDYPHCELIILDDSLSKATLDEAAANDPRIRHIALPRGMSIGAKRNRGVELARGTIIAQWDDDDWYSPRRLSIQAAPLLARQADITALDAGVWFDLGRWEFWKATDALHRRLFVGDVHGGTLVFRRDVWQRLSRYPDRSVAEDAMFLRVAQSRGARLGPVANVGLFVYVRHGANSWSAALGGVLGSRGWVRVAEPDFPPDDRAFYATLTSPALDTPERHITVQPSYPAALTIPTMTVRRSGSAFLPLVTCIMPTADRRPFVGRAIQYFLQQDYEERELIVVDDGADAIRDLIPADDPRVRYMDIRRSNGARRTIGAKRNFACAAAKGQIILHWDDDDWSAPDRITCQVTHLLQGGEARTIRSHPPEVCGLQHIIYYEPTAGSAWRYIYRGRRPWVAGNTLAYRKSLWQARPFDDVNVGEDARFLWTGPPKLIAALTDENFVVGLIHHGENGNVCPKRPGESAGACWVSVAPAEIRRILGPDWASIQNENAGRKT